MKKYGLVNEIRDMRDGDWYWISRRIFEDYASKIGVIGLALYNAYASYARDKGTAFPSQKTISKRLRIGISTIRKYNKILQANRLIRIECRKKKGKSNVITLLKLKGSHQTTTGSPQDAYRGSYVVPTKENNNKENTNEVDDKKSSHVKEVFSYFRSKVKEVKGFDPEIEWGKDGKLAKKRLKSYSLEEIKQLIDWYLRSKHCERLGVSLAVCLSGFVINLWKASKSQSNYLEKLYPTWQLKE
jgi:hypothetical protein